MSMPKSRQSIPRGEVILGYHGDKVLVGRPVNEPPPEADEADQPPKRARPRGRAAKARPNGYAPLIDKGQAHLGRLERALAQLESEIAALGRRLRYSIGASACGHRACPSCGATTSIGLGLACTGCGEEFTWGWWPQEAGADDRWVS